MTDETCPKCGGAGCRLTETSNWRGDIEKRPYFPPALQSTPMLEELQRLRHTIDCYEAENSELSARVAQLEKMLAERVP